MEIRTLQSFLTVLEEGSISGAAKKMHLTQPTVSRQLASLEQELGCQLYIRSQKGVMPTDKGITLRRYAESIVKLSEKAEQEVSGQDTMSGSVYVAVGETKVMHLLVDAMKEVQKEFPNIQFRMTTGTSAMLLDGLNKGLYDVMLECEAGPHVEFNRLDLPEADTWGLLVRKDHPLADRDVITPKDIVDIPLILSEQGMKVGVIQEWAQRSRKELNVAAVYALPLNVQYMVRGGLGSAILYEGLFETSPDNDLAFIPLDPPIVSSQSLIWRKSVPTKQTQVFLEKVKLVCERYIAERS